MPNWARGVRSWSFPPLVTVSSIPALRTPTLQDHCGESLRLIRTGLFRLRFICEIRSCFGRFMSISSDDPEQVIALLFYVMPREHSAARSKAALRG